MKLLNQILNKISSAQFNQVYKSLGTLNLIASAIKNDEEILNSFCVLAFDEVPSKNFTLKEYINRKADATNKLNLVEKHLIAKEVSKNLKDASAFYEPELQNYVKVQADFKQPENARMMKSAFFGDVAFVDNKYHLVNPLTKRVTAEFLVASADYNFAKLHEYIGEASKAGYVDSVMDLDGDLVVTTRPNVSYDLAGKIRELGYEVEEIDQTNYEDPYSAPTYTLRVKMTDGTKPADIVNDIPKEESAEPVVEKEAAGMDEEPLKPGEQWASDEDMNHLTGWDVVEGNDYYQIYKHFEQNKYKIWDIEQKDWYDGQEIDDLPTAEKMIENLAEGLPEKNSAKEEVVVEKKADATDLSFDEAMKLDPSDPKAVEYLAKNFGVTDMTARGILDMCGNMQDAYQEMSDKAETDGYGWDQPQDEDGEDDYYDLVEVAKTETEDNGKKLPWKLVRTFHNNDDGFFDMYATYSITSNSLYGQSDVLYGSFTVYKHGDGIEVKKDSNFNVPTDVANYFIEEAKKDAQSLKSSNPKQSTYQPFITVDASEEGNIKIYSGDHFIGTCKTIQAAFSEEKTLFQDESGVVITYSVYDGESELPMVWAGLRNPGSTNFILCSDAVYVEDLLSGKEKIDFLKDIKGFGGEFEKAGLDEEKVKHYEDVTNEELKKLFGKKPEAEAPIEPESAAKEQVEKTAGESYGWYVDAREAQEKLDLWIEVVGVEKALDDLRYALNTDELSECLAFIFRNNDFREGCSDYEEDVESAKKEQVEKTADEKIDFEKELMEAGESKGEKDKVNKEQLEMGKEVEKEHTTNPEIAEKITRDHLKEMPDYYTHLKKMEDGVEKKGDTNNEEFVDSEGNKHTLIVSVDEHSEHPYKLQHLINDKEVSYESVDFEADIKQAIQHIKKVYSSFETVINKKATDGQELKQFDMKQELDGQKEFEKQDDFSQVSVPEEKEDTSEVNETMEAKPDAPKGESFSAAEFGNNMAYIQQNNPEAFKSIMNNLKQIMVGDQQPIYDFLENWASHNFQDFTAMTREDPTYARHSQYQEQLKNNVLPKVKEMSEYKEAMEAKTKAEKGESTKYDYDSSDPEDAAVYNHNGEDEGEED